MVKQIKTEAYNWLFDKESRAWNDENYIDVLAELEDEIEKLPANANSISREFHFGDNVTVEEIENAIKFFKSINRQIKDYYQKMT